MTDYVSLIADIFQGYSELSFAGSSVFLRHINIYDQNYLSQETERELSRLIKAGVASEKDRLFLLNQGGEWTDNDDIKLSELEGYVSNLAKTKKKVLLPMQQREVQAEIDAEEKKILELKNRRAELIGVTAELFAARKANEEFLRHLLYKDRELKTLAFSEEEFGAVDRNQLSSLFLEYQNVMARFSEDRIQEASLQDFFHGYRIFCDKPWDMYGKPVIQFTAFQQRLIFWGKIFQSIFDNVEKIPDEIRKNPKELLDFVDRSRNKSKLNKESKGEGGTGFIVGTREDAQMMAGDGVEVGDLAAELKKSGGFLSQEDLMKKMGIRMG